ncbi:DUF5788 family protein [Halocalculus aciditolerans]|uniref:Uncharacterized protein n=1 Tax=Halocalculus aciditolerans TaxID=1383812 RepID=A0A830FFY2_9EURY|nr:DUF5788 family protein [Halocalculus aciditolerans]GGL70675.1 hypothetical protein GCM10009039_30940 [Halocalculus aciditolerans]
MKSYERAQLLERVERDGASVGVSMPDEVELDGEPFALREFVFEIKRLDGLPAEKQAELQAVKRRLRRARREREEELEEGDISYAEGEQLVEEVLGLSRALNALESLGGPGIEAEARASETADQKRWRSFLGDVLGWDDRRSRR